MSRKRAIGVMGGGSTASPEGLALAEEVGFLIARADAVLVCGGLNGVMEASAKGAKRGGGMTVGVLPTGNKADANPFIDLPIATSMSTARNLIIVRTADAESWGLPPKLAHDFVSRVNGVIHRAAAPLDGHGQERLWRELCGLLMSDAEARWRFAAHSALFHLAYANRSAEDGPGPAWFPTARNLRESNIGKLLAEHRFTSYDELHRWAKERREEFWSTMVRKLGIVFRRDPSRILNPESDPRHADWLPGAELNIAESCFRADPKKTAILSGREGSKAIRRMTYGDLRRLSARVANGLDALDLRQGARIARYLPMATEAVAAYLGIILSGRCAVGIADSAAPPEFRNRVQIANAEAVVTVDSYVLGGN